MLKEIEMPAISESEIPTVDVQKVRIEDRVDLEHGLDLRRDAETSCELRTSSGTCDPWPFCIAGVRASAPVLKLES